MPRPQRLEPHLRGFGAELLAATVAVLAFWNSLAGDFVWDDRILILEGQLPRAWDRLSELLTQDFFARSEFDTVYGYYRPLTTLSYLFDYSLWRLQPWGYHLTNVALHALASALAVHLLRKLQWGVSAAGLAGVLFAAHPIHSENVAWIAGRTDLLAFVFACLALRFELSRAESIAPTILATIAFLLAMLAKETAIVVIPWVGVIVYAQTRSVRAVLRRWLPYMIAVFAYAVWRFGVIHVRGPTAPPIHTPWSVALSFGPTLVRYLGWLILPVNQSAYVINPYVTEPTDPRLATSWLFLFGLAGALFLWLRRGVKPAVAIALAMFAVALLPNLNLIRPSSPTNMGATMAERFCYFPSFPLMALLSLLWAEAIERWRGPTARWLLGALAIALPVAGFAATVQRNRIWQDEPTFLTETLAASPQAILLWGRLAEYRLERRDLAGGDAAIEQAARVDPDAEPVLSARAYSLVLQGKPELAIPIQEELVRRAQFAGAPNRNNLAYLYRISGRHDDAKALLTELIAKGRGYGDVYANLAEVERAQGNVDAARHHYQMALRDRPDDLQVAGALVSLEIEAGRHDAAEAVYRTALRYHGNDIRILNNIAMIRAQAGKLPEAIEMLRQVLRDHPDYASARVNLAQLLYRSDQTAAALEQLTIVKPRVRGTELEAVVDAQLEKWRANSNEKRDGSSPR